MLINLVTGFAALGMAVSAAIDDILDIERLRLPAINACLDLLPQFVEPDFPQSILIFEQA
jgi:hypothetical protein